MKNFKYKLFSFLTNKLSYIATWFEEKSDDCYCMVIRYSPEPKYRGNLTCDLIAREALMILGNDIDFSRSNVDYLFNLQNEWESSNNSSSLNTVTIKKPNRFKV